MGGVLLLHLIFLISKAIILNHLFIIYLERGDSTPDSAVIDPLEVVFTNQVFLFEEVFWMGGLIFPYCK